MLMLREFKILFKRNFSEFSILLKIEENKCFRSIAYIYIYIQESCRFNVIA